MGEGEGRGRETNRRDGKPVIQTGLPTHSVGSYFFFFTAAFFFAAFLAFFLAATGTHLRSLLSGEREVHHQTTQTKSILVLLQTTVLDEEAETFSAISACEMFHLNPVSHDRIVHCRSFLKQTAQQRKKENSRFLNFLFHKLLRIA